MGRMKSNKLFRMSTIEEAFNQETSKIKLFVLVGGPQHGILHPMISENDFPVGYVELDVGFETSKGTLVIEFGFWNELVLKIDDGDNMEIKAKCIDALLLAYGRDDG